MKKILTLATLLSIVFVHGVQAQYSNLSASLDKLQFCDQSSVIHVSGTARANSGVYSGYHFTGMIFHFYYLNGSNKILVGNYTVNNISGSAQGTYGNINPVYFDGVQISTPLITSDTYNGGSPMNGGLFSASFTLPWAAFPTSNGIQFYVSVEAIDQVGSTTVVSSLQSFSNPILNPNPPISKPAIAAGQTIVCSGSQVLIYTSPDLSGSYNYLWYKDDALIPGENLAYLIISAPGSYHAYIYDACSNTTTDDIAITSGTAPASPPNIVTNNGPTLCDGATATIFVPGSPAGIVWSNGSTGPSVSVTAAGSYTARFVNACGSSGNSNVISFATASTPAAPNVAPSGPFTLCNGSSVTLFAGGPAPFTWYQDDVPVSAGNSVSVNTAGTYTAKSNNICGYSPPSNAVVVITGSRAPAPSLNLSGSITLCDGVGQLLSTSPSAGGTIHWSNGATGNSITVYSAGAYSAYESNICGNGPSSAAVNLTTLNTPAAPSVTPPGSQLVCNGQPFSFSASGSNITWSNGATGNTLSTTVAGSYYAYDHNYCGNSPNSNTVVINTGNCPTPSPGTAFFICPGALKILDAGAGYDTYAWSNGATTRTTAVGPGNYAVTVTKNGCAATSVTVSVSYYAVTIPSINASGPTIFCAGNSVTLSSSPASAYAWSNGSTASSINVTTSGSFYVTVTDANGCQATSAATNVTVNPLPIASISGTNSVCKNAASPMITFTGNGGTAPYTFFYNINGGTTQTITSVTSAISVSVPATTAGTYTYNLVGVQESSSTACYNAVTGSATITVRDLPVATIAGSTTVCLNSTSPLISFTGSTGNAPFIFTYNINGGANQTVTTVSGNSVSITAPTNIAGTYSYTLISVQESSGLTCSNLQNGTATVIVRPLPTATIAGTTTVCQNSSAPLVSFTGSVGTAPYTFTYNINGGVAQTITTVSGNSVSIAAPTNAAGTFSYNLISVQESGTGNCSNAASGSTTVIVNPLPWASISGSATVCQNATAPAITLTGSNATAPYTFAYRINGGAAQTITTTSGNSVSINAPTNIAGTFTYDLISVQESSNTNCSNAATGTVTIVVRPLPTATAGGSTIVCQNSTRPMISFTGATGNPPYTFTYNINGGPNQTITTTSGSSANIDVPTNISGTFDYNLVGVQESGSPSCVNMVSATATVIVNPLPSASIAGNTIVCKNAPAPGISFTGSGATAPYTFTYKINGGSNQTITTTSGNSVTINAPTDVAGTFTYTLVSVQESSGTGCINTASGSATIVVRPLPTATIAGSTFLCQNSASPLITFAGSVGTAPYTFSYNINGGAAQTVTTVSGNSVGVSVPTASAGTFMYNLLSVQESGTGNCSNTVNGSATVIVNPLSAASIAGSITVCQNSATPLVTFTGSNATAPYSFSYRINGGALQTVTTNTGNSVSVTVPSNVPGTFTYSLVSVNESSNTTCTSAVSGSAVIIVNPQPAAAVLLSPNMHLCNGDTGQLTIYNWTEGFTYRWYKDGVLITTSSAQTLAITQAGSYTVMVTSNLGCDAAMISNAVIITTGSISAPVITGSLKVCEGGKTKLLVSPTDKNLAYEVYRWNQILKEPPIGDSLSNDKSFSALAGQYQLRVEREGCYDSVDVVITANDTEFPAGQLRTSAFRINYGEAVNLFADVTGAVQYRWDFGDGTKAVTDTNTVTQHYFVVGDSIPVKLIAVSERNCMTAFAASIAVTPQTKPVIADHSFTGNLKDWNLFPTPFHNDLKLSVILDRVQPVRLDFFTADGSWVRSWQFPGKKGENLFTLDKLETLKSNVLYFATSIYNNQKHFDKVFKY